MLQLQQALHQRLHPPNQPQFPYFLFWKPSSLNSSSSSSTEFRTWLPPKQSNTWRTFPYLLKQTARLTVLLPLCVSCQFHRQWRCSTLLWSWPHVHKMPSSRSRCFQSHLLWTRHGHGTAAITCQTVQCFSADCHRSYCKHNTKISASHIKIVPWLLNGLFYTSPDSLCWTWSCHCQWETDTWSGFSSLEGSGPLSS